MITRFLLTGGILLGLYGCSGPDDSLNSMQSNDDVGLAGAARPSGNLLPTNNEILELRPPPNPERNAWFGDLHVQRRRRHGR